MNLSENPSRSISDIQAEVKKIDACVAFQSEELRNQRKQLLYDSKCNTDLRCINFIRSFYLLQMSIQNVENISRLPFMFPNGFAISERLIEMAGIGYLRLEISRFLQAFFKLGSHIPNLIATIRDECFYEDMNFIPDGIKPKDFFACSTFPSLFAYCWTPELQSAYINTLVDIARFVLPVPEGDYIQNHWLFDCIRCYIFSSNIQDFIRVSIGDVIVNMSTTSTSSFNQNYFTMVLKVLNKVFELMKQNLVLFPKDARLLIKKFAELADDDNKLNYVECIFIECIIIPVISNLIAFVSPYNQGKVVKNTGFSLLIKFMKKALNPDYIDPLIDDADTSILQREELISFYKMLIDVDDQIEGPSLLHFLSLLEIHYNTTLFSVPDVCLLAFLSTKMMPVDDRTVVPAAKALLNKVKGPDYRFFRHETWDFDLYRIKKPECIPQKDPSQLDPLRMCANSLYKFLTVTSLKVDAPPNLDEYLKFQELEAKLSHDTKTRVYLCHLSTKIASVGSTGQIVDALLKEIEKQLLLIKTNASLITEISLMSELMSKQSKQFQQKLDGLMAVLYSRLLELFLKNHPNVMQEANSNSLLLVREKLAFDKFFNGTINSLSNFLENIAPYAIQGVAVHLHTHIMKAFPLDFFLNEHMRFEVNDDLFRSVHSSQIDSICSSMNRENLPSMLSYGIRLFRMAVKIETPLIALRYISKACKLITQVSTLFVGKNNNLKRMMSYAILKANCQHTFSYFKYLEFFLNGITANGIPLFTEKMGKNLLLYSRSIAELDIVLCEI
ncbi:hypothetical protein TRFO_26128 [Tritrichomonas foetus]|uniref:Uncharacterized protein n=1 Tax=Tritrichomonas foetus TaxID=1144522 RepID=A0A1J4K536_9EUKA|nr:hypothetical protein TRFO_26128 [Tritrichomonas foetus]|eukprot:OHT05976.1 hypothetical protein TRFO_26128 [Tritrichomonas foetus]